MNLYDVPRFFSIEDNFFAKPTELLYRFGMLPVFAIARLGAIGSPAATYGLKQVSQNSHFLPTVACVCVCVCVCFVFHV